MKLIVEKDYRGMSKKAADILVEEVKQDPQLTLGLATGSTPVGMYEEIVRRYKDENIDFSQVKTINLDEYVGLDGASPSSYRFFMNENLFDHINIDKSNTHVPNGKAEDLKAFVKEYDELIEELGVDLQILGIGTNGHIAFNEPARELSVGTSVVNLTQNTISDNSIYFETMDEVPKTAISMGIGSILKAKKILLLASGAGKKEIIKKLLNSETVTTDLPASFLLLHDDVTIIVDEAAYKA